uniref:Uncharacterized protein n=1 Tax=Panagrolaimus sp. PS1159 TaxID=55785 RepID=A0AC35GBD3_9BILA
MPVVTVAATVYIPELLDCEEEQRFQKLSSLAHDKGCRLASTLLLEDISIFGHYAKELNTALVSHINFLGFRQMILKFTAFEHLHVVGDEKIQNCVEEVLLERKDEDYSATATTSALQSVADSEDNDGNENVAPESPDPNSFEFLFESSRSPSPMS